MLTQDQKYAVQGKGVFCFAATVGAGSPVTAGRCMTTKQMQQRGEYLRQLAQLHIEKWKTNGNIKLLKIAHDLKIEAALW